MQISYDGTSLVSTPFRVSKLTHENADSRVLNLQDLARQRGGVLINAEYKPKLIRIIGNITGTDNADLEGNIDEFKELLNRQGKNLDVSYDSGTRRFVATCQSMKIEREFFNLNYAPFEVEMLIPAGVGYDITTTSTILSAQTSKTLTSSLTIAGTAEPKVKMTITVTAATAITACFFLINGYKITLTNALVANDVVIFDADTMKVTLNGVEKDYTGIFPDWVIGINAYYLEITGTSITYDLTFSYIKTYL